MVRQRTIVLATGNVGKIKEISKILEGLDVNLALASELLGRSPDIEETGQTFEQNAFIKAEAIARMTGLPALADDSGLEVDALGGRPGVFSARYGGVGATDEQKTAKLLGELQGVTDDERTARFRCAVSLVDLSLSTPDGVLSAQGACEGRIAKEPRGQAGFGYDPVFLLPDVGKTMAELSSNAKNARSHRAAALTALLPALSAWLARPAP